MFAENGSKLRHRYLQVIFTIALSFVLVATTSASGSDFVVGELSIATAEIKNARDYRVKLRATSLSNVPVWSGGHTNGWIGVNLDSQDGTPEKRFTQVGILTGSSNSRWFVYSEAGVSCLRGQAWLSNRGCLGNVGDIVSLNTWHWVEMVYYPGQPYWVIRVYNSSNSPADVALVHSTSLSIYRAYTAMENAYTESTDPYYIGKYEFSHPQWIFPVIGFQEWPKSDSLHHSYIEATPTGICPSHYGATLNLGGDDRVWFAGSGSLICNALLFPSRRLYLPMMSK